MKQENKHEEFLNNKKDGLIEEKIKVSLEEAETMYERGDNLHSPEEKAKEN